jgi:small subunit ribosomal protein S1
MSEETILVKQELANSEERLENANVPMDEFDWDAHEAQCPKNLRKPNRKVKAPRGVKIMSHEPYAQDLLNLYLGYEIDNTVVSSITTGEIYEGTVYSINQEWASIDINYREMVYVNMLKEEASIREMMTVGAEVKVQITGTRETTGRSHVSGSVSSGVKTAVINELMESIDGHTAFAGRVSEMIPGGGYIVNINGIGCFMPGSLAGINKLADFESIVGTDMYVVPMSFSQSRGTIVVSHREYLKAMIPSRIEELKENLDAKIVGQVTGSAKYGVFVEFHGCLTGMIHVNDLSPELAKRHKARDIQPGEDVEFKIKEIVSNEKIILTQLDKPAKVDPWDDIENAIKVPAEVTGTIKSVKDYGVFVEVAKGLTGLLHVSELPEGIEVSSLKSGDKITVTVTRIDSATRKIFLKL